MSGFPPPGKHMLSRSACVSINSTCVKTHQETCHLLSPKVEKLKRNLDLKKSPFANLFSGGKKCKETLFILEKVQRLEGRWIFS